ncbi:MaoC/PaaZ C-terminal domain-containing protein [Clostridium tyrobutyricum]|uniref:MaoC/PaaZ C-terminal domain-containing protein n=1 Tax=Clostridium tyrobutyricum TaxID=1519 RepID=UPI001C38954C|nr:MaoC/PaaZ C-terminal domain-containing protein [Clostridium tyrobutyricum]MBV4441702.1 hypothetical protein [Clostridium tyrobutyricum]
MGKNDFIIKRITKDDINTFTEITSDYNMIHIDDEYAQKTIFKNRIHGMMVASLIIT